MEYSWVKATAVSVRLRILFVTSQSTNRREGLHFLVAERRRLHVGQAEVCAALTPVGQSVASEKGDERRRGKKNRGRKKAADRRGRDVSGSGRKGAGSARLGAGSWAVQAGARWASGVCCAGWDWQAGAAVRPEIGRPERLCRLGHLGGFGPRQVRGFVSFISL